jgi:hypothetical protein
MCDGNVGKCEISDFAKNKLCFPRFLGLDVRAAKEKRFLIVISEAQEIPAMDSLVASSNRL